MCPASDAVAECSSPGIPRSIPLSHRTTHTTRKRCSFRRGSLFGRCRGAAVVAPLALPLVAPASLGLGSLRPPPLRRPPAASLYLCASPSAGARYGPALPAADAARAGPTLGGGFAPRCARSPPCPRLRFARGARERGGAAAPPPSGFPLPAAVLRTALQPGRVVRPPRANPTV